MTNPNDGSEALGMAPIPATVEEAISLLRRVADHREEYSQDADLTLSIDMLRVAAHVIETGDIAGLVPSWRWHDYLSASEVSDE